MEFNFPLNVYFKNEINKIGSRLLPVDFSGDRREVQECVSRMSTILTAIGENSAKAQGLQKVITSGDKLRNSDYSVYILVDLEGGSKGNGTVLGMLKVGVKHLYLFDSSGENHEAYADCILDFYIHESKQRMGLGKKLFEYMLKEENVQAKHMAIDKPSPKLLSFLHKHYGLETIIPQMNNFVIFEGFFDNRNDRVKFGTTMLDQRNTYVNRIGAVKEGCHIMAAGISSKSCLHFSGNTGSYTEPIPASPRTRPESPPEVAYATTYGRRHAHHPVSTMGLILQNQTPAQEAVPAPSRYGPTTPEPEEPELEVEEPEPEPLVEESKEEPEIVPIEGLSLDEMDKVEANGELPADLLPCKVQAGNATHLDLKFYHSSLW